MNTLTDGYTRRHFDEVMRRVSDDHAPVMVTNQCERSVVIMSLDDYHALEETAYLLRNPTGAARLMEAVGELAQGGGDFRTLDENAG
uniref:Antitoxin n=1 Tax=Candidatus Kentrum sp. DK TaxID=2126562 RepID=A0A450SZA7_9GAMM|nr:MAG: antitoxin YefM [Candidatus Kentron sp. DK]